MNIHNERRLYDRINLSVRITGSLKVGNNVIDFTGVTETLSESGLLASLTGEATGRLQEMVSENVNLVGAPVRVKIVSYIEDNIMADAKVARVVTVESGLELGLEFVDLSKSATKAVANAIAKLPALDQERNVKKEEYRFATIEEFISEVTTFTLLVDKTERFWIKNEQFIFVGMHQSDTGEVHTDCITSVSRSKRIYCPDCRDYIDPVSLL